MLSMMFWLMGLTISTWITPQKNIWELTISQSAILLFLSIFFLKKTTKSMMKKLSAKLATDKINSPLMILSCWLTPVSMAASMKTLNKKHKTDKQNFITLILLITLALIMTFSTTKLLIFFLGFESTLVPTLILISRWGMKKERMEAGYFFVFYTLISSLPLFMGLLILYNKLYSLKMTMKLWKKEKKSKKFLAMFCILAFLVKIPIFGFHLWLPKAHVEAPVAGSMILAAMLLKMGGYGLMRLSKLFWIKFKKKMSTILMMFCCWGGALTSLICLTQTDLKSLMAYSSVSHMSLMVAGMSTKTNWAIKGSIMVMVAHGLVSSALFLIANMFYERSGTRTLIMSRGLKKMFSILPMWWLMFACANLGLPPLPNSMGEILMFSSALKWNLMSFPLILTTILLTSMFSLSIFQYLNSGKLSKWKTNNLKIKERESTTLMLHILPLMLLIMKPNMMML